MKKKLFLISLISCLFSNSQSINLNESHIIDYIRSHQLIGNVNSNISFTIKPFDIIKSGLITDSLVFDYKKYSPSILNFFNNKGVLKILPIDFNFEYNSHHPYNRNNGSMIPNKGLQKLTSLGFYFELGPISIQLKPEYIFSENKPFEGFPESHYNAIWAKRYALWNTVDIPERFGEKSHSNFFLGQSNLKLNFKDLSLGISNENLWWGPSIRNSIMLSNNAKGFRHISFHTNKPIKTKIGDFEWQFVTGRLEKSNYTPPNIDKTYAGTLLYSPKINQVGDPEDWRYFQGIIISYSPKFINGLTIGHIRWVQMYSALLKGKYTWMEGKPNYFPLFSNIFRKNDNYVDYEDQTDQAGGFFFRWLWEDSKSEIYSEFHYNDAKLNFRDLLLDSDHSRAITLGLRKVFTNMKSDYLFSWEWTQLEQTASRKLRGAGSWYRHSFVMHGFTNNGEIMGAAIGPGSNSHFFSIEKINQKKRIGFSLEIVDQDNDFYYYAFEDSQDYRRYWKDFNFHINYQNKIKNLWIYSNLMYSRSLNYQWELDDNIKPYYHPGRDANNFYLNLKISYEIPLN